MVIRLWTVNKKSVTGSRWPDPVAFEKSESGTALKIIALAAGDQR
jgi:hypothetical protein